MLLSQSNPKMSKLGLGLRIFILYSIFLAQGRQGYRFLPTNQADNVGVSPKLNAMKGKASNPQVWDPKSCLLNNTESSMIKLCGTTLPFESSDDSPTLFAVHKTEDNDKGYYGLIATMDVYGYNLNGGQMSTAGIWINNEEGDWEHDLDSITVGWVIFPSHFSDSRTHLFTHWTTGCLNMDCPGFQLSSGSSITPGDAITAVSDANGAHQNITIKLFKDKSNGDWWLHYGFNSAPTVVGYFPSSLFNSLSKKVTEIFFGGHVHYTSRVQSPPMGSGAFPSDKAASFWDLQLINEDGNSSPINNDLPSQVTDEKSYSVSPIEGAKFSYGGPGGHSA